jgi:hypothetical protein
MASDPRGPVAAMSHALINRAMPDIRHKVANLRKNQLDPKKWCVFVGTCDAGNPQCIAFAQIRSPQGVPVGPGHVFMALIQTQDLLDGFATIGAPEPLRQQIHKVAGAVPGGSVMVVCSVSGGMTSVHMPFADKDLPPAEPTSKLTEIPPIGRRRSALIQAHSMRLTHNYGQMLAEGLDPASTSVLVGSLRTEDSLLLPAWSLDHCRAKSWLASASPPQAPRNA